MSVFVFVSVVGAIAAVVAVVAIIETVKFELKWRRDRS